MTATHGFSGVLPLLVKLCLVTGLLGAAPSVAADPDEQTGQKPAEQGWRVALSLGVQSWPALADLEPATGGDFDSAGMVADLAVHGPAPFAKGWLLGLDVGISNTQGNVTGLLTELDAEVLYLTPSVKIPLAGTPLLLDLGLGYYRADFSEVDCDLWYYAGCVDLGERWSKSTVGGYAGATWDIPLGKTGGHLALSLRVNYADFGTPDAVGQSPGQLDGPSAVFLVGYAF
jgi:hypothetical protein